VFAEAQYIRYRMVSVNTDLWNPPICLGRAEIRETKPKFVQPTALPWPLKIAEQPNERRLGALAKTVKERTSAPM